MLQKMVSSNVNYMSCMSLFILDILQLSLAHSPITTHTNSTIHTHSPDVAINHVVNIFLVWLIAAQQRRSVLNSPLGAPHHHHYHPLCSALLLSLTIVSPFPLPPF